MNNAVSNPIFGMVEGRMDKDTDGNDKDADNQTGCVALLVVF